MSNKFLMIAIAIVAALIVLYWFVGRAARVEAPIGQMGQSRPAPEPNQADGTVELERPPFLGE